MPMDLPVIDLLTELSEHSLQIVEGDFEEIAELIEEVALGYFELEEQSGGMVADYDHGRFALCEEL